GRWPLKTGFAKPMLVRQTSIKHVSSLAVNEFALTKHRVHFRNAAGVTLSCFRHDEEYPDLSEYFAVRGEPLFFPPRLTHAVESAAIWSAKNQDGGNRVMVELEAGRVRISGDGVPGEFESNWVKMKYMGRPVKFLLAPQLLLELIKS